MKCPACGNTLRKIFYTAGEWLCDNPDCPEHDKGGEWYGFTQKEINSMWSGTPAYYKKAKKD